MEGGDGKSICRPVVVIRGRVRNKITEREERPGIGFIEES